MQLFGLIKKEEVAEKVLEHLIHLQKHCQEIHETNVSYQTIKNQIRVIKEQVE